MYCLSVLIDEKWTEFASVEECTGDYAEQVKAGVERKMRADNEELRAAAELMQAFVLEGAEFVGGCKRVMRALRRFDEVGISNELCEKLEEAFDEGAAGVRLIRK